MQAFVGIKDGFKKSYVWQDCFNSNTEKII